jgi:hypothetical protein
MEQERMPNTFEFLKQKVYLPGYMALDSAAYDINGAEFKFNVKEPKITRGSFANYFTPRGLHICISQAGYALTEYLASKKELGDLDIPNLRTILLEGRVKITELYQKFRKEVGLLEPIPGRIDITRLRLGKTPVLKFDFEFGARAVTGNLVSIIAPKPMPQLNQDLLRFKIQNGKQHN